MPTSWSPSRDGEPGQEHIIPVLTLENDDSWLADLSEKELPEGISFQHVYYSPGANTSKQDNRRYSVNHAPTTGWSMGWIIQGEGKKAKHVTLLCPYSLEAFSVPQTAGEIEDIPRNEEYTFTVDAYERIIKMMRKQWAAFQGFGYQKDYDTVAFLLRKLGEEVPEQVLRGGEADTRTRGGKETGEALKKPVKKASKRGKFLEWFLGGEGNARSVRETMAEFGMTRSNALSYLYMIQKDHGIGYVLQGDIATVTLPDGCTNPFDE